MLSILGDRVIGGGEGGCIVEMSKLQIMPSVSYFKRLTCLFVSIMVEVTIEPWLKNVQSAAQ